MGRPERTLDDESGPVAEFALRLRALRRDAGSPVYRELARRANYSVSALSNAARGHELPSLEVTLAFVTACGGDRREWERQWQAAKGRICPAGNGSGGSGARDGAWVVGAELVLGIVMGAAGTAGVLHPPGRGAA
ncbi:helix-turn-helix domain-containing protein [Microbispora sp. RL4-1S]|uniref:Helix-turn-helix domain-containing protein n=1 Tax=Microbispora oryzae TaxID=2806554 RepID=A0A940WS83_9ACTN|nr:helix-turn-helix transcriptional regulator [Microbispora oryzae]MBP2708438.1 helix-turn-helix domain-containing protein [Microbispora oryzae]